MPHPVIDLIITKGLQVQPELFQTGSLVTVVLDKVQIVLPELPLAEVVRLDRPDSCFSGHDSSDQAWAYSPGTDGVGEPCRVPAYHVTIRYETIVLVWDRDLPGTIQVTIIG